MIFYAFFVIAFLASAVIFCGGLEKLFDTIYKKQKVGEKNE